MQEEITQWTQRPKRYRALYVVGTYAGLYLGYSRVVANGDIYQMGSTLSMAALANPLIGWRRIVANEIIQLRRIVVPRSHLPPPPIRERGSDQHNDRQQQAGGESGKPFVEDEPDKAEDHRG